MAKDLKVHGHLFAIMEPGLLQTLTGRLQHMAASGRLAELQQHLATAMSQLISLICFQWFPGILVCHQLIGSLLGKNYG